MHFSIDRTVHTMAFDKPVVDHWLEQKIAQTRSLQVITTQKQTEYVQIYIYQKVTTHFRAKLKIEK